LAIKVVTSPTSTELDSALAIIETESFSGNQVTPRSRETLIHASGKGNLLLAYSDDTLAGWGLIEPLTRKVSELGMTYIRAEFRNQPVFAAIAATMDARSETLLMATYHPHLASFAIKHRGFSRSSLAEFIWVSRGKFLFKRLGAAARKSVNQRLAVSEPSYVIRRGR
jgi:hypothetical protein